MDSAAPVTAPAAETVGSVLARHRAQARMTPDGGLDEPWVVVKLGPVPMPFPNSRGRRRAVDLHDVNHLVSGYRTHTVGEGEISAWELGSGGCGPYLTAWLLDLAGLLFVFFAPVRVLRAFRRGRRSRNAYAYEAPALMAMDYDVLRRQLAREPRSRLRSVVGDALWLAVMVVSAVPAGLLLLAVVIGSAPLWLLTKGRTAPRPGAV